MRDMSGMEAIALLNEIGIPVGASFVHSGGPAPEDITKIQSYRFYFN